MTDLYEIATRAALFHQSPSLIIHEARVADAALNRWRISNHHLWVLVKYGPGDKQNPAKLALRITLVYLLYAAKISLT